MHQVEREAGPEAEHDPGREAEGEAEPMRQDLLSSLRRLTDAELVARVEALAKRERGDTAQLVAHLAELDTRDVYLRAGYSSLFTYCRDALALSEHEAYNRIEVARAARRFPVILELLASGTVHLTTVRLLSPHLTPENHRAVLESARGKKRTEVEEIVARLAPFPEAPSFVRKLPAPRPALPPPEYRGPAGQVVPVGPAPAVLAAAGGSPTAGTPAGSVAGPPTGFPSGIGSPPSGPWSSGFSPPEAAGAAHPTPSFYRQPSGEITPLAPDRYRLQCTIDGATLEKLRLAKDMLRHAIPSGDDAAVLDRAFTALLADLARSKFAAVENPQPTRAAAPGSRHIPADVKRAVWVRDLGRCAFVGTDGRRCNERAFVEFHHVRPYAVGGEATVGNIQLRCRRHNGYEARVYFDKGEVGDGEGIVREPAAPYAPGGILETGGGRLVSNRVRTTPLAGSKDPGPGGWQAGAIESTPRHSAADSTRAASGRGGRAAGASAGRSAGRGSRPPPRRE
jgi:hypothetical protein